MKLSQTLDQIRARGEKSFIAYLTAGDPTIKATQRFVQTLSRAGVSVIELGVPHSDPVADGPTNARAAERALKNHTSLSDVLDLVATLRQAGELIPLVLFTYLNPILRMGVPAFAKRAKASGVSAVLVVDLPPEEAKGYLSELETSGIETVFLASPTTRPDRLATIGSVSSGFVYYVSRTGVTGVQKSVASTLREKVAMLRQWIKKPICVGFGVSSADQVREVLQVADGVVVGSCFVDLIEKSISEDEAAELLEKKARELLQPLSEMKKESQC